MSRYIDLNTALSYPFANGKYDKENANPDFIRGCESYKEWLKGLPAADVAPRWIPVSERLPEEDGDYLVVYEKGYAEDYGFDRIGIVPYETNCAEYGGFGIWQERFGHYTLGSLGSDWVEIKVVAWMPLPEPWKGEAE